MSDERKWGKPGWNKQNPKGKLIIHNATKEWIPDGMDVKVRIEGVHDTRPFYTEETISPGQRIGYQPPNDNKLKVIAKSKVSAMKPITHEIPHPLSREDMQINIAAGAKGSISLLIRRV